MSRIGLIIQREYLVRVKKKSFIIMTFLTPLLFVGMMSLVAYLTITQKDESDKQIVVIDESNQYKQAFQNQNHIQYIPLDITFEQAKDQIDTHYALLHIKGNLEEDPSALELFSTHQVNSDVKDSIRSQLNNYIKQKKIAAYQDINLVQILDELDVKVKMSVIKVGADGSEKKSISELVMAVGTVFGFVIYMFIFVYGAQVMRGVIEEKTGRIVEIIVSSVKPFELMMGKIVGIAMVGLTQFLMWILLSSIIGGVVNLTMLGGMDMSDAASQMDNAKLANVFSTLSSINIGEILFFFIIYFIGGYLLYAAMFAAIGGAVDNETDTQQFMLPVTLPMIFAIYVGMSIVNNPNGALAVWCSIIPFTSPVVMMVRLPFDVPLWQKLLSVFMLIITFIGMTWGAAKIYRTGILIYGKKISYKELWKWLRY